jgi:histidinol-phosphate aminotransferase
VKEIVVTPQESGEKLIRYLNDVKYSFNSYTMNYTAIKAGEAALEDRGYFEYTREKIIATRERSKKEMEKLGFIVTDSRSNFLFVRHKEAAARDLFRALREAGIIVRYFDKPRIDNYLRITVGTDEQMDTLFAFLESWLKKEKA